MKNITYPLLIITFILFMGGCATLHSTVHEIKGQFYDIQGQYYLDRNDFAAGKSTFAPRLAEKPDDPALNYYMARFELGADNPEAALPLIQKAVRLSPGIADYHFWEGVTWWALMKPDKEKAAYEKALAIDPNHFSGNLYLGHNLLDRGKNAEALKRYELVLSQNPAEPQAMFNKAVALERQKKYREMKLAMQRYLELYPDAALARQGARMLNKAGDFSWRNHPIGLRTVTLHAVEFKPGTAELTQASEASLDRVGDILSDNPGLGLHVVVYVKNDADLARARAQAVQDYVSRTHSGVGPDRLTPRWVGKPETITAAGRKHTLAESVNIFTRIQKP